MINPRTSLLLILLLSLFLVQPVSACTIFMASSGDDVLAGNNEDWYPINSYIQFIPGDEEEFGQVYFGTSEWYAEGGMNTAGLFYDAAAIPEVTMNDHPEKSSQPNWPPVTMLESCANLSEAIQLFNSSRFDTSISWQLLVADGNGDAAVFAPGSDGEWHFISRDTADFLVVTNFNLAITPDYTGSLRYNTATNMLEEMGPNLSVEYFTSILDAVHNHAGGGSETIYSNICDLVNKEIYLFYNQDFSQTLRFNLEEELLQGPHLYKMADLFPEVETTSTTTSSTTTTETTQPPSNPSFSVAIPAMLGGALFGLMVIGFFSRRR